MQQTGAGASIVSLPSLPPEVPVRLGLGLELVLRMGQRLENSAVSLPSFPPEVPVGLRLGLGQRLGRRLENSTMSYPSLPLVVHMRLGLELRLQDWRWFWVLGPWAQYRGSAAVCRASSARGR